MKQLITLIIVASLLFAGCSKSPAPTTNSNSNNNNSNNSNNNSNNNTDTNAVFTLGGGGNCTGAVLYGIFQVSAANSDTVIIDVNVTAIGSYNISTDTVNGIFFNKTGRFTSTGTQTIALIGSGAPTAAGTNNITIKAGSNNCIFSVTTAPAAADYITCDMGGVYTTFNVDASASNYAMPGSATGPGTYYASGLAAGGFSSYGSSYPQLAFGVSYPTDGKIRVGTFTNANYSMGFDYDDASATSWATASGDVFTITVTFVSDTNIQGTFSGTIKDGLGLGTNSLVVTNGQFNLPVTN